MILLSKWTWIFTVLSQAYLIYVLYILFTNFLLVILISEILFLKFNLYIPHVCMYEIFSMSVLISLNINRSWVISVFIQSIFFLFLISMKLFLRKGLKFVYVIYFCADCILLLFAVPLWISFIIIFIGYSAFLVIHLV